jgi:hypothetical protein
MKTALFCNKLPHLGHFYANKKNDMRDISYFELLFSLKLGL